MSLKQENQSVKNQSVNLDEQKIELTNDMMKIIQNPGPLHLKLIENILESTKVSFEGSQGFLNAKDFQIQCLFEYEKLRTKGIKKKKGGGATAVRQQNQVDLSKTKSQFVA